MRSLSRRRLLLGAGGVAAAATAGVAVYRSMRVGVHLDPQLESLITAGIFSADLGAKCLEDLDQLANAPFALLHDEIMDDIPKQSDRLLVGIGGKVVQDFAEGRVCRVDGWVLAVTECRLAALAFLFLQAGGRIDTPPAVAEDDGPIMELPEASIAQIEKWGPRSATVGKAFNVQPNGSSALWFLFAEMNPHPYEIYIGASPLRITVVSSQNLITASVPKKLVRQMTSKPADLPVHLVNSAMRSRQLLGHFSPSLPPCHTISRYIR